MLNRIANITAGSDFKSSAKQNNSIKYGKAPIYHIYDGHDSINISPAYNFLTRHNWKIKELNIEDEKVHICFTLSGFDFTTIISLKQINQLTEIEYTVSREKDNVDIKNKVTVDFLVNLSKINYNEDEFQFTLPKLDVFFDRLVSIKGETDVSSLDRKIADKLIEGLARGIQDEFDSINNGLFIFVEKYFNVKISGWNNKAFNNSFVIVTKISPFTQST
jgi:hypothetical protein